MQSTSYLPGFCYMKDLNVGNSGNPWPIYRSTVTPDVRNAYNILCPPGCSVEQYSNFNKEFLRQTMIKHEGIFRAQVFDLHRLYKRQREMMDDLEKRKLQPSAQRLLQTPQQEPFLPSMLSESLDSTSHFRGTPLTNQAAKMMSEPNDDNYQASSSALKIQHLAPPINSQVRSESNIKKIGKIELDLELPADTYIDAEEMEGVEDNDIRDLPQRPFDSHQNVLESWPKSDLKVESGLTRLCQSPSSSSRNSNFWFDLNEPMQLDERGAFSDTNIPGCDTKFAETRFQDNSESVAEGMKKNIDPEKIKNDQQCVKKSTQAEQLSCKEGSCGSNVNSSNLQILSSGESIFPGVLESHPGQNSTAESHDPLDINFSKGSSSCISTYCPRVPDPSKAENGMLASLTSLRKIKCNSTMMPIVQALPCFNTPSLSKSSKASTQTSGSNDCKTNQKRQLGSLQVSGTSASSVTCKGEHDINFGHSFTSKRIKSLNYENESRDTTDSCLSRRAGSNRKLRNRDEDNKTEDGIEGPYLRTVHKNDGKVSESPQILMPSSNLDSSISKLDPSESRDSKESEKAGGSDNFLVGYSAHDSKKCGEAVMSADNEVRKVKTCFDLNSCLSGEVNSLTPSPVSDAVGNVPDLEAPVSPENKECTPPRRDPEDIPPGSPHQVLNLDDNQKQDPERIAAEAIMLISSSISRHREEATPAKLSKSSNCLDWFAGIVSSVASIPENGVTEYVRGCEHALDKQLDNMSCFQFSITGLREVDLKGHGTAANPDMGKEREKAEINLPGRLTRCRARKVRQQTKLLRVIPSCNDASQHRDRKQIQKIDGSVAALSTAMEKGSGRKRTTQSGSIRRRRQSNVSIDPANQKVSSILNHSTGDTEGTLMESCLPGWGKTNRRRRALRNRVRMFIHF